MSKSDLKIQIKPGKESLTIVLIGEAHFDLSVSDAQVARVRAAKPQLVIVDARKLTFVSSTGICFLIGLRKEITGMGGRVILSGLQPLVRQALERAHVLKLFEVEEAES